MISESVAFCSCVVRQHTHGPQPSTPQSNTTTFVFETPLEPPPLSSSSDQFIQWPLIADSCRPKGDAYGCEVAWGGGRCSTRARGGNTSELSGAKGGRWVRVGGAGGQTSENRRRGCF